MKKLNKVRTFGPLRLKIPDATKALIAVHKTDGDFAAISTELFGDNSNRQLIKAAVDNGEGRERIVNAIVKFYKRKLLATQKLT